MDMIMDESMSTPDVVKNLDNMICEIICYTIYNKIVDKCLDEQCCSGHNFMEYMVENYIMQMNYKRGSGLSAKSLLFSTVAAAKRMTGEIKKYSVQLAVDNEMEHSKNRLVEIVVGKRS
jgi:hypothetical protein